MLPFSAPDELEPLVACVRRAWFRTKRSQPELTGISEVGSPRSWFWPECNFSFSTLYLFSSAPEVSETCASFKLDVSRAVSTKKYTKDQACAFLWLIAKSGNTLSGGRGDHFDPGPRCYTSRNPRRHLFQWAAGRADQARALPPREGAAGVLTFSEFQKFQLFQKI